MKIVTSAQMRQLDEESIHRYGISSKKLMENAGRAVFEVLHEKFILNKKRVVVVCGPGNNGGDGLVIARHLKKIGAKVSLVSLEKEIKSIHKKPDLIIDALFGIGLARILTGAAKKTVEWINAQKAIRVSVDIPSGLNADTGEVMGVSVKADLTVTLGLPKIGLLNIKAADFVGELCVVPIGLAPQALKKIQSDFHLVTPSDFASCLEPRKKNSNKGTYGHVMTVAGSYQKIGAGILSAIAALKSGAGLSTLVLPDKAFQKIDTRALEIMYAPIGHERHFQSKHLSEVMEVINSARVVAIGPGLGTEPGTIRFAHQFIQKYTGPLVIDADALNALSMNPDLLKKRRALTVLTPHPGEMARLIKKSVAYVQNNREKVAREFSKQYRVILVLKGYRSLIAFPDGNLWISPTGNPAMASAGQGDALTGIISAMLSQFSSNQEAVLYSVYMHGWIGDFLSRKKKVVLASDIINNLDIFWKSLVK